MFNAPLRKKFTALLEEGAVVVVWHYFPTDWPHMDTHDDRFNMRVRKNYRSIGNVKKLIFALAQNSGLSQTPRFQWTVINTMTFHSIIYIK